MSPSSRPPRNSSASGGPSTNPPTRRSGRRTVVSPRARRGGDPAADSSPEGWLESREDVLSKAGARFGDAGVKATDDRAGEDQGGQATFSKTRGIPSQSGAELSDPRMERGNRHLAAAGLPANASDEGAASAIRSRARAGMGGPEQAGSFAESLQRGARGGDLDSFLEKKELPSGTSGMGRDSCKVRALSASSRARPGCSRRPLERPHGSLTLPRRTARPACSTAACSKRPKPGSRAGGTPRASTRARASGGYARHSPWRFPPMNRSPRDRRHGPCEGGPGHRQAHGSRVPDSAERRSGVPSRGCSGNKTS